MWIKCQDESMLNAAHVVGLFFEKLGVGLYSEKLGLGVEVAAFTTANQRWPICTVEDAYDAKRVIQELVTVLGSEVEEGDTIIPTDMVAAACGVNLLMHRKEVSHD